MCLKNVQVKPIQTTSLLGKLQELSQNPSVKASKVLNTKIELAIAMHNFNPQGSRETLKEVARFLGIEPSFIIVRSALAGT